MAFVAGSVLPHFSAKSYSQIIGANEKINVSVMGVNSRGKALAQNFASQENCDVIHICDVDRRAIINCMTALSERQKVKSQAYTDFRKSLESKDVDALVIAAPDHWHAQMMIDACKAGKDVMCEKPLTLTIAEGRKIVETARRYGRIAAGGSQRVLQDYGRRACAANSPSAGKVLNANAAPGGPPKPCYLGEEPIPEGLNWNFWLGPAPWAPHHSWRCSGGYGLSGNGFRSWED